MKSLRTFLESETSITLDTNIKDWWKELYPDSPFVEEIRPAIKFSTILHTIQDKNRLNGNDGIYSLTDIYDVKFADLILNQLHRLTDIPKEELENTWKEIQ